MAKIWEDEKGLYVKAGSYIARPGDITGYSHAYRMDEGGLVNGDAVPARHIAGSPLVCITLTNGEKIYWYTRR